MTGMKATVGLPDTPVHSKTVFYRVRLPTRGGLTAWLYYDYGASRFRPVPVPIGNDGPEVSVRPDTAFRHEELALIEWCFAYEFVAAAAGFTLDGTHADVQPNVDGESGATGDSGGGEGD